MPMEMHQSAVSGPGVPNIATQNTPYFANLLRVSGKGKLK
jgi:hypothetical protein